MDSFFSFFDALNIESFEHPIALVLLAAVPVYLTFTIFHPKFVSRYYRRFYRANANRTPQPHPMPSPTIHRQSRSILCPRTCDSCPIIDRSASSCYGCARLSLPYRSSAWQLLWQGHRAEPPIMHSIRGSTFILPSICQLR